VLRWDPPSLPQAAASARISTGVRGPHQPGRPCGAAGSLGIERPCRACWFCQNHSPGSPPGCRAALSTGAVKVTRGSPLALADRDNCNRPRRWRRCRGRAKRCGRHRPAPSRTRSKIGWPGQRWAQQRVRRRRARSGLSRGGADEAGLGPGAPQAHRERAQHQGIWLDGVIAGTPAVHRRAVTSTRAQGRWLAASSDRPCSGVVVRRPRRLGPLRSARARSMLAVFDRFGGQARERPPDRPPVSKPVGGPGDGRSQQTTRVELPGWSTPLIGMGAEAISFA